MIITPVVSVEATILQRIRRQTFHFVIFLTAFTGRQVPAQPPTE
jgi:hypothetical protein